MIDELLNKYDNGEIKSSKAYVQLRAWKSEIEEAIKHVERGLVYEITAMGQEDLVCQGFKISHLPGRISLDYKASEVYQEYEQKLNLVKEKLKQATKLKSDIVDPETGELYEPLPTKHGKGFIKMEKVKYYEETK